MPQTSEIRTENSGTIPKSSSDAQLFRSILDKVGWHGISFTENDEGERKTFTVSLMMDWEIDWFEKQLNRSESSLEIVRKIRLNESKLAWKVVFAVKKNRFEKFIASKFGIRL